MGRRCSSGTRRKGAVGVRAVQLACVGEEFVQVRRIASSTELCSHRGLKDGSSESSLGSNRQYATPAVDPRGLHGAA